MKLFYILLLPVLLNACASSPKEAGKISAGDPLESYNRTMYDFNKKVDSYVLRPVAVAYDTVTPKPVDKGIGNFFSNLAELNNVANALFQGKFSQSGSDSLRFLINSTLGIVGLVDVASSLGLEKHDEDFGQTLAIWGVDSGPYIMLPFLGPTTLRNLPSKGVEHYLDPLTYVNDEKLRYGLKGLSFVDLRQRLLDYDDLLEESFDEYTFVKDAYLNNRNYKVHDGSPPHEKMDDIFNDTECDPEFDELC